VRLWHPAKVCFINVLHNNNNNNARLCSVHQVGAALRPAFTPETAPDVTAAACEVSHLLFLLAIYLLTVP